jgi:hypothetical protein
VALRDEREAQMKVLQDAMEQLGDEKPELKAALSKLRSEMEKSLG